MEACDQKEDRLSSLDDELLATILSQLPIKTTVAMSILSHRWRTLWTKLTSLRITRSFIPLSYNPLSSLTTTTLDTIEFIEVTPLSTKEFDKLMRCSLVVLKLGKFVRFDVPKNGIHLPNLRVLHLWGCDFSHHELMENDLSESFPLLEELHFSGSLSSTTSHYLRISASNLKKLTMDHSVVKSGAYFYNSANKPSEVHIDAPNLRHFTIKGEAWLTPYFDSSPIYLSAANISLGFWSIKPNENRTQPFEIIEPLYNAKFLDIRGDVYYGITDRWLDDSINLPVFDQLETLKVNLEELSPKCMRNFFGFLKCCPALQVLYVRFGAATNRELESISMDEYEGLIGHDLLTKVKKITLVLPLDLNLYGMEEICYILKVAKALQMLNLVASLNVLYHRKFQLKEELNFCQKLYKFLHDYSVSCEIKFTGRYLKVSTEGMTISQLHRPYETLLACSNSTL